MNFRFDLTGILERKFFSYGIEFEVASMRASHLAASYFEMLERHIMPKPRKVYWSRELRRSLKQLALIQDHERRERAQKAISAVYELHRRLTCGGDVTPFLSKSIKHSPLKQKRRDGMLWSYGMHHFHLSPKTRQPGFVCRSDFLLFAIVRESQVYFVDVRRHPKGPEWVQPDLLDIVLANWPGLIRRNALHGNHATTLTKEQEQELRRKNVNVVRKLGNLVVAPLGWGTTMAGTSTLCQVKADRLLFEIKKHEEAIVTNSSAFRGAVAAIGVDTSNGMHFELVSSSEVELTDAQKARLRAESCLSRGLFHMGYLVVERTMRVPVICTIV